MEVNALFDIPVKGLDLLLLDLDNTLYEYKRCHEFALSKLVGQCETIFNISQPNLISIYNQCRNGVHNQHSGTANEHSRLLYIQSMIEKINGNTETRLIRELYEIYWNSYIEFMQLFKDAIPFLENCLKEGVQVIMVTDMVAEIQFRKIERLGIGHYFNFVVTSEEAGVEKPHPYIFELAISKGLLLNQKLKKIGVAGDNVKKDTYHSCIYSVEVYHILRDE